MSDNLEKAHSLSFSGRLLTVNGVVQVLDVSEREAHFKLHESTLAVKGAGLNVVKLDRDAGVVQLETQSLQQLVYHKNGASFKGLFR